MSDENITDEGEGIKSLRKQYDTLKKQNDDLLTELGSFRNERRTATVEGILKAKGVPASAAKLYTGDDVSEDAVGSWVDTYADVLKPGNGTGSDPNAQAAQRVSDASFGSVDSIQNGPSDQKVLGNPEEIMRAIQTLPMEDLVRLGYMPKDGVLFNPKRG